MSNYPGAVPLDTEFPTSIRCTGPSGDAAANTEDQLCEYGGFTYTYNARGQQVSMRLSIETLRPRIRRLRLARIVD